MPPTAPPPSPESAGGGDSASREAATSRPPVLPAGNLWSALLASRLNRVLAITGALALVLAVPGWMGRPIPFWAGFCRFIFYVVLLVWIFRLLLRLIRRTMWSLRNRLLVAYALMAAIPIILIVAMAGIAAYLFYGQYSAYLLNQDLAGQIEKVSDTNRAIAAALSYRVLGQPRGAHAGHAFFSVEAIVAHYDRLASPGTSSVASFVYTPTGRAVTAKAPPLAKWLRPGFSGVVAAGNELYLAAYTAESPGGAAARRPDARFEGGRFLTWRPVDQNLANQLARRLGVIGAIIGNRRPGRGEGVAITRNGRTFTEVPFRSSLPLPSPANRFDIKIVFGTPIPVTDWTTGRDDTRVVTIATRPSLLNERLFSTLSPNSGDSARWPLLLLGFVGVLFLFVELVALLAGIRLTRSITRAVHGLYVGTQRVHRGDFSHRIAVRSRDQLADLGASFNEMTDSIAGLLSEQRQKERLENELLIAREVQEQLFPHGDPRVAGLEIRGRCLPARSVSGDYFDFFDLDGRRVGFALGDVSGKGISAALLMATVASAMRAYQGTAARARGAAVGVGAAAGEARAAALLDRDAASGEAPAGAQDGDNGAGNGAESLAYAASVRRPPTPAALMRRLNSQLCRSTTPEKYVTLFYGLFDAENRELLYCNAGHLPPILFTRQGRRRLDQGGMVVGLFEEAQFEEARVQLEPGDLLVAWSDGITEPENEYGVEFGEERLVRLIESHRQQPVEEICQVVLAAVREWGQSEGANGARNGAGAEPAREQSDDITLLMARVR